jgi:hypothetical protein
MASGKSNALWFVVLVCVTAISLNAQSFRVQCPTTTITHPNAADTEPQYNGPTTFTTTSGYATPATNINGAIKCQQISGGDGYSTMADGTQTYMFSFGPLSGLAAIAAGLPGTQFPTTFNTPYSAVSSTPLVRGDPATTDGATDGADPWTGGPASPFAAAFQWNGAVGLAPEVVNTVNLSDLVEGPIPAPASAPGCPPITANTVTAYTYEPLGQAVGQKVTIAGTGTPYDGPYTVTCVSNFVTAPAGFTEFAFQYIDGTPGLAALAELTGPTASTPPQIDGHVDPRPIIDVGVMNGNIPAPLIAFDEDDEFFLTLTNVGMIMRPDLFEQHTVHFHGYPNASAFYDGVPDASVAINIGGSFTYYYLAPDAGSYFWHCHITPPEHLQMGMVGQLYVRPRQNRVPANGDLYTYLGYQNGGVDLRTACNPAADILCSATMPAINTGAKQGTDLLGNPQKYVYNDGDGSTAYDVEYPLQMHGFDPNFHFVGMTFNPEMFVDMKDKYFLLNGRSYPDTVSAGPQATVTSDGQMHYSQPLPAIINIPVGGKASLRLVNLSVTEYHTIQTLGVPMKVVGWNAKLLRDQAGMNTEYYANSITLAGGESCDVLLDATSTPVGTYYLFTPMLDHLANDLENFGGLMTEVHVCNSVSGGSTFGNTCN